MKYIALTNQLTDDYSIIQAGNAIPDGALSDASLKRLEAAGLVQQIEDEALAEMNPPAIANQCEECE